MSVLVDQQMLGENRLCNGGFFARTLDHITTNAYEPIDMYDSNGAGVAVNDLDQDGDIDIVMANLAGENTLFWNDGDFKFRPVRFPHGSSRAVSIIDVDGDSWLDVVFTTRTGFLSYWRHSGEDGDFPFEMETLDGVKQEAYAVIWSDLDRDGDLDLVTGSYDTALEKELRDSFMFGDRAGVFVYTNENGRFDSERLIDASQVLALEVMDLNGDGLDDILVGNDFDSVRDNFWLQTETGWEAAEPFLVTTQNTMSFDLGDVNNDGEMELFAADMHQYAFDEETNAAWEPAMVGMTMDPPPGDPQRMENMLQMRDDAGEFVNMAYENGIAYSGWSWSSRFGDLDQDGFLDLYIVNGMVTAQTFGHMPDFELVEENQAFRNLGDGRFEPAVDWFLNGTEGGRGMTMADLDGDGDLDIVVNNLLDPAVVYENRICQGDALLVDLRDLREGVQNRFAIGAVVELETSAGIQIGQVRSAAGYLSGPPVQLHFGIPSGATVENMVIKWPDGHETTMVEIEKNQKIMIQRNQ